MEPTLYTDNILVTDRMAARWGNIGRGDIVIAICPTSPETSICKRVVGIPGDKILMKPRFNLNPFSNSKSTVDVVSDLFQFLDGDTPNVSNQDLSKKTFQSSVITVPRGHVWLEGDNFQNSSDSRIYGPVPLGLVKSRVICRLWPLNEVKLFI